MTLLNYDKEALSCRGEAAGPIAAGLIQMMRRGLQRQSSRWSFQERKHMQVLVIRCQTDLRRLGYRARPPVWLTACSLRPI
jgi:hypothetical protein